MLDKKTTKSYQERMEMRQASAKTSTLNKIVGLFRLVKTKFILRRKKL